MPALQSCPRCRMPVGRGARRCSACGYVLPRRSLQPAELLAVVAAAAILLLGAWLILLPDTPQEAAPETAVTAGEGGVPVQPAPPVTTPRADSDLKTIIQRAAPAVVRVDVRLRSGAAAGSGFVCSGRGMVITNSHVVAGATDITVVDAGNHRLTARLLAVDKAVDLALLEVQGLTDVAPLQVASTANLAVGDKVVAIGSPEGLTNSVSEGIVSGLHRNIRTASADIGDAIQTSAPVSHGSSGGPLIDVRTSAVVGVLFAGSDTGQNLGFAIPGDVVLSALKRWGVPG